MAARTLYPAWDPMNYSESKWSDADDDDADLTKPVAGDTIICTTNSGKVTCDETWATASLSATGACEWDFGAQTATVSGDITLDDITATAAAATISASNLDIGTNGSLTLSDDLTYTGDFELDGGTFDPDSNDFNFDGALMYSSGTLSNSGKFTLGGTGAHNVSWNSAAQKIAEFAVDTNATATLTGTVYCSHLSGDGTLVQSQTLRIEPTANNFYTFSGVCEVHLFFNLTTSYSLNQGITIGAARGLTIRSSNDSLTAGGTIDVAGSFIIYGTSSGQICTLDMGIYSLIVGSTTTIGITSASNNSGILDLGSGTHSFADLNDGNAANLANALDFGSSLVSLSGTLDGDNIILTNTNARVSGGGTIQNADCSGTARLTAYGCVDGGSNLNISFGGGKVIGSGIIPQQM